MDVEELVDRSGLALEARVVQAQPVNMNGDVYTDYQLAVDRTWWGEPQSVRTVRLPGGALPSGRVTMVPGMPSLVPGDDVVLLLTEADDAGRRVVVGLSQGRWRIVGDGQGGKLAVRDDEGGILVAPSGTSDARMDVLGYAELVSRLEAATQTRRARGETWEEK